MSKKKKTEDRRRKRRQKQLRKERLAADRLPSSLDEFKGHGPLPFEAQRAMSPRPVVEGAMLDLQRAMEGREFKDKAELDAFMAEYNERQRQGLPIGPRLLRPEDRAQDLTYAAMEAADPETALSLVHEALELDPDCIDALLLLAEWSAETMGKRIDRLLLHPTLSEPKTPFLVPD